MLERTTSARDACGSIVARREAGYAIRKDGFQCTRSTRHAGTHAHDALLPHVLAYALHARCPSIFLKAERRRRDA